MQRRHVGHLLTAQKWIRKIIDVKMDDIEPMRLLKHLLQLQHMVSDIVDAIRIEAQGLSAG